MTTAAPAGWNVFIGRADGSMDDTRRPLSKGESIHIVPNESGHTHPNCRCAPAATVKDGTTVYRHGLFQ